MNQLLKQEIAGIINQIQRGDAPAYSGDEGDPVYLDTQQYQFDIVDSKKNPAFIQPYNSGTASYINGSKNLTYELRFVCYEEYLQRLVYDDGKGHANKSRLKDEVGLSDFVVYDKSNSKVYFIIHELSDGSIRNKRTHARKQLSDTINQLYKSNVIAQFIDTFSTKLCIVSAKDDRKLISTNGMAEGFEKIYQILPEPIHFTYGQMKGRNFDGVETSVVKL